MFFPTSEEDDGSGFSVGVPTGGPSALSSLFGKDEPGNTSLKYTAPKQPRAKGEETQGTEKKSDPPALLKACACHTYRLVDGKYQSLGKLGAALLGNHSVCDYKILLYVSQKKPVTTATVNSSFKFNVQQNNYATFYDNEQRNWSLCFDNETNLSEFAKWVGLAIFNVSKSFTKQDLNEVGTGQQILKGDTVEMQYTGWLHENNTFGKIFDSSKTSGKPFKFKVGKGKVIKGMEDGVIGMRKGSKRLLLIPSEMAYGSKSIANRVPPNSTLIFEIEVTRVKFAGQQEEVKNLTTENQPIATHINGNDVNEKQDLLNIGQTEPVNISDEIKPELHRSGSIKDRTKSINDQLSKTPENSKSKLLERMSRMGQSVMSPQNLHKTSSETELSGDSPQTPPVDIEGRPSLSREGSLKAESPKPVLKPKPEGVTRPIPLHSYPEPNYQQQPTQQQPTQQQATQQSFQRLQPDTGYSSALTTPHQLAMYQHPQQMFMGYQQPPMQPTTAGIYSQTVGNPSTDVNLLVADGKVKHTEIKSELTRMLDKLENISNQVNLIQTQQTQMSHSQQMMLTSGPSAGVEMDAVVIMQNVSRIIKENEKLRNECEEKSKKIENLNDRMTDLLTKNQLFFEKSNQLLVNQSSSMQNNASQSMEKVQQIEQQKLKLESEMEKLSKENLLLKNKEEESVKNESSLSSKVTQLKKELSEMKQKVEIDGASTSENESLINEMRGKLKDEKKEQKKLKLSLEQLEDEMNELKMEKESLSKNVSDLKNKRKQDQHKFDEENEELKTQHEDELRKLHQRYKKSDNDGSKLEQLQEELEKKYREKLSDLQNQHKTAIEKLQQEKDELATNHEKQLQQFKEQNESETTERNKENAKLQEEIMQLLKEAERLHKDKKDTGAEASILKDENETLKNSVARLQEELNKKNVAQDSQANEESLSKLRQEIDEKNKVINEMQLKIKTAEKEIESLEKNREEAFDKGIEEGRAMVKKVSNASYERGLQEGKTSAENTHGNADKDVIAAEVKKVMNNVFFQVKNKFNPDEEYQGKNIILELLNTIKAVTLRMVRDDEDDDDDDDEDEEDESSSEEEEDDEDNDDSVIDDDADVSSTIKVKKDGTATLSGSTEEQLLEEDKTSQQNDNAITLPNKENNSTLPNENQAVKISNNDLKTSETNVSNDTNESKESLVNSDNSPRKNTLESVGLDSSLFDPDNKKPEEDKPEENIDHDENVDGNTEESLPESEIFFSPRAESANDSKKPPSGLFAEDDDNSDDDGLFSTKSTASKSTAAAAFNRTPPPLFEDDDDDTNWI